MIVGYREYKYVKKNKEYIRIIYQIKCSCGMILGQNKLKDHITRWTHHYYAGTLDKFNSSENKIDE